MNKGPKVDEDVNSIPKSFPCTTPGLPRQQVGPDVVTSDFTSGKRLERENFGTRESQLKRIKSHDVRTRLWPFYRGVGRNCLQMLFKKEDGVGRNYPSICLKRCLEKILAVPMQMYGEKEDSLIRKFFQNGEFNNALADGLA